MKKRKRKLQGKRMLALLLAFTMGLGLYGCGGDGGTDNKDKEGNQGGDSENGEPAKTPDYIYTDSVLPIVKEGEEITLTVLVSQGDFYQNMDSVHDVYFVDRYEEMTNVHIEWIEVSSSGFADRLALMMTSGQVPDVILKSGINNANQLKYGEDGFFLNLMENDLLERYAPNYWALCQEFPEILSAVMQPDGSVYSVGMVRNSTGTTVPGKYFMNKEWLDNLGLSVPTTSEQLYDMLYQFKHGDPNGNGREDEIPLYCSMQYLQDFTYGMFGIGNRGDSNSYIDWDEENECVRFFATSDGYRQWVEYIMKLYQDGLISREFYDYSSSTLTAYLESDVVGSFAFTNLSMAGEETASKFTYLNGALTGPNGDNDWYGVTTVGGTGSYIITTACEHPEVAMLWVDYLYSNEGALFYSYGDEGVTYEQQEDGSYQFTDYVLADYHNGTNTYDGCATKVSLFASGNNPIQYASPYYCGTENMGLAQEAANALIEDCAIAWPYFTFTTEEQRIISNEKQNITDYIASMRDSWIMGLEKLTDESWQNYVSTIESMGVSEVVRVYEAALQRAYDNGFEEGYHTLDQYE